MKLTQEDIEKLRTKEIANAIRKLNAGKTLTTGERALLAQQSVGGADTSGGGFAQTWDDLASRLGTTRRAIQDWRRDPRYKHDAPKPRADGRHDVTAWAEFMVRHGLKRADEHIGDMDADTINVINPPPFGGSQADWSKACIAKKVERAEIELEKLRGTLLVAAELEAPLGACFVAVQNKLAQFPDRTAALVAGFTDVQEIIGILRAEIDADLTDLHGARYLEEAVAMVQRLPFDSETEEMMKLITFDGQDRALLFKLIAHIVTLTLISIGQRALASLGTPEQEIHEEPEPAEPAPVAENVAPAPKKSAAKKPRARKAKPTTRRKR